MRATGGKAQFVEELKGLNMLSRPCTSMTICHNYHRSLLFICNVTSLKNSFVEFSTGPLVNRIAYLTSFSHLHILSFPIFSLHILFFSLLFSSHSLLSSLFFRAKYNTGGFGSPVPKGGGSNSSSAIRMRWHCHQPWHLVLVWVFANRLAGQSWSLKRWLGLSCFCLFMQSRGVSRLFLMSSRLAAWDR